MGRHSTRDIGTHPTAAVRLRFPVDRTMLCRSAATTVDPSLRIDATSCASTFLIRPASSSCNWHSSIRDRHRRRPHESCRQSNLLERGSPKRQASLTRAQKLDLVQAGQLGSSSLQSSLIQTAAVGTAPATVRLRAGLDSPAAGLHSQRQKLRSSTSACLHRR